MVAGGLGCVFHNFCCPSGFGHWCDRHGCAGQFVHLRELPRVLHSHLISTHKLGKLLDEETSDKEREDLADAEAVCRRFLQWNLGDGGGNVKGRLAEVLGRKDDDEE
ncbi:hypothetical protein K438DRAFT_1731886 [Mycena galopus ATCC 62051]|nr:hypothetical protein K438DRAFT_1731886 [Mycena galopus ATCC 62051]